MKRFRIVQSASGTVLFDGQAADRTHALDLMARNAGYLDYNGIPREVGGWDGLLVTEVCDEDPDAIAIEDLVSVRRREP